MVDHIKSLGVIIQRKPNFELHMSSLLKQCNQRMYLLRLLRNKGLSADHLNTIFHVLLSRNGFAIVLLPLTVVCGLGLGQGATGLVHITDKLPVTYDQHKLPVI